MGAGSCVPQKLMIAIFNDKFNIINIKQVVPIKNNLGTLPKRKK